MAAKLIGDGVIEIDSIEAMRSRGGTWAAYQNHDLGSRDMGGLVFLRVGPGCTFEVAPERAPDSASYGLGWRYLLIGLVDLAAGRIVEGDAATVTAGAGGVA